MLIGGFSAAGESAATFSRSSNNRGGYQLDEIEFPGARSNWSALPLNDFARKTSIYANAREAFNS
jgi:hypothetical protein